MHWTDCFGICWWRRLLAGVQLTDDAQLPADVPSLMPAQVAAAEERAGSPHADVINSFFELQASRSIHCSASCMYLQSVMTASYSSVTVQAIVSIDLHHCVSLQPRAPQQHAIIGFT